MAIEIRCSGCGAKGKPDEVLECSCPSDDIKGLLMFYILLFFTGIILMIIGFH